MTLIYISLLSSTFSWAYRSFVFNILFIFLLSCQCFITELIDFLYITWIWNMKSSVRNVWQTFSTRLWTIFHFLKWVFNKRAFNFINRQIMYAPFWINFYVQCNVHMKAHAFCFVFQCEYPIIPATIVIMTCT
jgi:hypothetical protein